MARMARRETAARHDVREARQRRSRNVGWLDAAPYDHVADLAPPEPPRVVFQASARPPGHHPPGGAAGRRGVDSSLHGFCPHPPPSPSVRRPPSAVPAWVRRYGTVGYGGTRGFFFFLPLQSCVDPAGLTCHGTSRTQEEQDGLETTTIRALPRARLPPPRGRGCFYVHVSSRLVPGVVPRRRQRRRTTPARKFAARASQPRDGAASSSRRRFS